MAYLYALVAGATDLIVGWFALRGAWRKLEPRYFIAFAAGALLGTAFFHVLPELNLSACGPFVAGGFMTFYVLEKLMMIHACGEKECEIHRVGPIAVIGMALDNVVDGVGMVVGYTIDPLLGFSIAMAVVLHEIPQGMASTFIMQEARWSRPKILLTLLFSGLLYFVGSLLAGGVSPMLQQKLLAFVAGDFIYLGAADMLPEAHQRFNGRVILCVVVGMLFMAILKSFLP